MKRLSGILAVGLVFWLVIPTLLAVTSAWAKPTTPEQARTVVLHWLGLDAVPLRARMGRQIKKVQTFNHGEIPAYYVVYLNPSGMVFVAADDLVEPIIGFLPSGKYDPSSANPLGALVSRDIPGRVAKAQEVEAAAAAQGLQPLETLAPKTRQARARRKWTRLSKSTTAQKALESSAGSISDVRVAPLVESKWDQSTVNGYACYNYYTPPYSGGNGNNYVCGCVATSMAQLMRYWTHPTAGIGVLNFTIRVDNIWKYNYYTRGGDGVGGSYNWAQMELDPLNPVSPPLTQEQRQAIGALTYDAGLSVHMEYASDGSGAYMEYVGPALTGTFGYSNAIYADSYPYNLPESSRNAMLNANLHARYPVILGIYGSPGGHAIICDGYGYNSDTMYHHLNLGWSGINDAWYNLPTVDTLIGTFSTFDSCTYNIYKPGTGSGSGEIIAGRVTDNSSPALPLSGVTVTVTGSGGPYTTTTDTNGIYALAQVPSGSSFTVSASKEGYTFVSQKVNTGNSIDGTINTGNLWDVNFEGTGIPIIPLSQALDNDSQSFNTSGGANWYGEDTTSYYGGSAARSGAIIDNQDSQMQTTVVGPGTLSFYWKVSSEASHDFLDWYIDDANPNRISGEVDWTKVDVSIPRGIHTITWKYSKDFSLSSGSDCGWVDQVVYTQTGSSIAPILQLLLNSD